VYTEQPQIAKTWILDSIPIFNSNATADQLSPV